jgi:hypothetical protein
MSEQPRLRQSEAFRIQRLPAQVVRLGVVEVQLYEDSGGEAFVRLADVRRAEAQNRDLDIKLIRELRAAAP